MYLTLHDGQKLCQWLVKFTAHAFSLMQTYILKQLPRLYKHKYIRTYWSLCMLPIQHSKWKTYSHVICVHNLTAESNHWYYISADTLLEGICSRQKTYYTHVMFVQNLTKQNLHWYYISEDTLLEGICSRKNT